MTSPRKSSARAIAMLSAMAVPPLFLFSAYAAPIDKSATTPAARVALSRLTVRQYRNAVADLIGSFSTGAKPDERRGSHAKYFKTGGFRPRDAVLERIDPQIRFDFGTAGPRPRSEERR